MNKESQIKEPFILCDSFLKGPQSAYFLGNKEKQLFDGSLRHAFEAIKKMENDEVVEDFDFGPIEQGLNFLRSLSIEQEYKKELVEFIKAYNYIAFNLNENTIQNDVVRKKISYLQRYCDNALTYTEYLNMMKTLTSRMLASTKWTPPSFRLSEHYYNILKEE